jgi:ABC-type multidrug transport system permease subunit
LKIKTQNAALGLSQAIYFVLMGISGIFYPLEKSPDLLRKLSVVSPLKYISKIWESAIYGIRIFQIQDVLILSAMIVILGIFLLYISRSGKRGDGYESCPSD